MSEIAQSRNVPLTVLLTWLGRAKTSYIAALNSQANWVTRPRVVMLHQPFLWPGVPALSSSRRCVFRLAGSVSLVCQRAVFLEALCSVQL